MDDGPRIKPPPPEARLITEHRGRVSIREAARQAGVSETTWRKVEAGRRLESDAPADKPYNGKAATIAAMAQAVGVTPDELEATRRINAIEAARIMRNDAGPGPDYPDVVAMVTRIERARNLTRQQKRELFAELVARMGEAAG